MSVILEALKKLDREKPSRKAPPVHIATEILKPDIERRKRRIPLLLSIVFLTALATAVLTYVLFKEFGFFTPPPSGLSESNQTVSSVSFESRPGRKIPAPAPVNPPEPLRKLDSVLPSREPVSEKRMEPVPIGPRTETGSENKITKAPETPAESKPVGSSIEVGKVDQGSPLVKKEIPPLEQARKTPEIRAIESANEPPVITISAIVWYEDRSLRFAVVNGIRAVEGDLIEGAKILEIRPTSIRFLYQDKPFEVSISR